MPSPPEARGASVGRLSPAHSRRKGWGLLPPPALRPAWLEALWAEPPLPTSPGSLNPSYYLICNISVLILKEDLN